MKNIWAWRLAIVWFIIFTVVSLGTSIQSALMNVEWAEISSQSKFMAIIGIVVTWGTTIGAFVSKQAQKIEETGELDLNGNIHTPDSTVKTTTITATEVSKTP